MFPTNNQTTALYGLIGGSPSMARTFTDILHNHFFQTMGIDALYEKHALEISQLPEFLLWAKEVSVKGLSVTMPLKEAVVPCLDRLDVSA